MNDVVLRLRLEGRSPHALGRRRLRRQGRRRRGGSRFDPDGRLRARIVARRGRRDPRQARAASLRNPQRARQLRGAFSALQLGDVLREGVPFFFALFPAGPKLFAVRSARARPLLPFTPRSETRRSGNRNQISSDFLFDIRITKDLHSSATPDPIDNDALSALIPYKIPRFSDLNHKKTPLLHEISVIH